MNTIKRFSGMALRGAGYLFLALTVIGIGVITVLSLLLRALF